jgi:fructosamine-3-kinase
VLDHLDLQDAPTSSTMEELGRALACLHHVTGDRFGWHRPNYIGSTPQTNTPHADWVGFFIDCRLRPQLELASGRANTLGRLGTQLIDRLPAFFSPYQPVPSLLHGDLWGGNAGATTDARPVMFDPAVYYGDRETDLAMTELFGGFPRRFYDAYRESWPLDDGYAQRKTLYQLYHVLNHFNLFGGGYATQAERMLHRLLSEIR